jgi:hypothetical protein
LYLYSFCGLPWSVLGWTLPLIVMSIMSNEYKHNYILFVDEESYISIGKMCSELRECRMYFHSVKKKGWLIRQFQFFF